MPDTGGKIASKYRTARFILVPALLEVPVPGGRFPGRPWQAWPPVAAAAPDEAGPPIRIGYARCSTRAQELEPQLVGLRATGCSRIFSEKISTRVKVRPELAATLALCRDIRTAAPDQPVIVTVHEMKRLARNAAELMTLSGDLQAAGIQLELLTGGRRNVRKVHRPVRPDVRHSLGWSGVCRAELRWRDGVSHRLSL